MTTRQKKIDHALERYREARKIASAAHDRWDLEQQRQHRIGDRDTQTLARLSAEWRSAQSLVERRYIALERARSGCVVRRPRSGVYEVYIDGIIVGSCAHTGTHLDDYPWDASVLAGCAGKFPHTSAQASKRESINWIVATVEAFRRSLDEFEASLDDDE